MKGVIVEARRKITWPEELTGPSKKEGIVEVAIKIPIPPGAKKDWKAFNMFTTEYYKSLLEELTLYISDVVLTLQDGFVIGIPILQDFIKKARKTHSKSMNRRRPPQHDWKNIRNFEIEDLVALAILEGRPY